MWEKGRRFKANIIYLLAHHIFAISRNYFVYLYILFNVIFPELVVRETLTNGPKLSFLLASEAHKHQEFISNLIILNFMPAAISYDIKTALKASRSYYLNI